MPGGIRYTFLALAFLTAWGQLLAAQESLPDVADTASSADKPKDELDRLMDMDIDQLSRVSISATNPIVEGVSKKAETLAESPGIVQVITAEEIRGFGAKTLREVLTWGTSIWTPNSAVVPNNVTSIRGDLPGHYDIHVLLLLNGRPFKDTHVGGLHHPIYTAFPIASLERIEIIRGPGSVLYGTNAYVGVINLITKDPTKSADEVSSLAGSLGTQRYEFTHGAGCEHSNLLVGAMYLSDNGFDYAAVDELGVFDSRQFDQENLGLVAVYQDGPWALNAFVAQANSAMLGSALARWRDDGFLTSTRAFCDVSYTLGDPDEQSLETHFTYNYADASFWGVPPFLARDHLVSHDYLIEPIYRLALRDNLDLMVGSTFEFRQGHTRIDPPPVPEYTRIWYSVYAQLDYQATDWLKLVGGMQGNMPGEIKGGIVPRAGAIVSLTENWTLKALYGSAFRSPAAIETDINAPPAIVGNPDLEPETVDTFDGQLAYSDDKKRLAATYFHSDYSDVIGRDTSVVPPQYENLGTLEVEGVELEGRWKYTERLQLVASTTWQQNVNDNGVWNATHVPNWMAKYGFIYETRSGLSIGVFDSYFSAPHSVADINPAAAIVNPEPEAYHLLSVNARYDLSRYLDRPCHSCEVQFLVQNALDEEIWHPEFSRRRINSVPAQAGRTFYGGFTWAY